MSWGRERPVAVARTSATDVCCAVVAAIGISAADARKRTLNDPDTVSLTLTGQALPVRHIGGVRREHVDRLSTLLH